SRQIATTSYPDFPNLLNASLSAVFRFMLKLNCCRRISSTSEGADDALFGDAHGSARGGMRARGGKCPERVRGAGPPRRAGVGRRFQVHRGLKRGGGVETLLGRDAHTQEAVVIKRASGDCLSTGAQMRLEHEAGVLRQVRSPWLAPLLHLGREQDLFYLVMPLIPGVTLQRRLEQGPLTVRETLTVGRCL